MLFARLDAWRAPAPRPERVEWLGQWRYAHRGLHTATVPENSPSAFAGAIARGMGIECDVQHSLDGQAMVFHDPTLDRLTGEDGELAQRDAEELGRIKLAGSDDTIPTLRQLLDMVASNVPLLIEIKSDYGVGRQFVVICRAVRRALEGYRGPHAIMSFDPRVTRWFADHSPATLRGLVMTEENDRGLRGALRRHLWLWHARPEFLAYDIKDLPSRFASSQRERGLPLLTWTVCSQELAARAAEHADAPIAEDGGVS